MVDERAGEDWHIAKGTTVLLAAPGEGPAGVECQLHESAAVGEPKSRADLMLSAFVARVCEEPRWAEGLLTWWLDRGREDVPSDA